MDEKTQVVEQTVEGNEETGTVDTQTTKQTEGNVDTKVEAQKIADAMLAKKLKGMPSKEELKAFKEWQESQKTELQRQSEKEIEFQKALSEKETLAQENMILKAGVNAEDSDYVLFKVSRIEGDFEENLKGFLKDNPKYLNTINETKVLKRVGTSLDLSGKQSINQNETNQIMNDLIRSSRD